MFDLPLSPSFSSRPQLRIMSVSFQKRSGSINIRLTCLTVLVIAVLSAALVPPAQAAINDNEAVMANRSIFKSTPNPTKESTLHFSSHLTKPLPQNDRWCGLPSRWALLVNVSSLMCGRVGVWECWHWHFDPLPSFLVFFLNHVQQTDAKIVNQGSGSAEQLPNGPRSSILDNIFNVSLPQPARFPESLFNGGSTLAGLNVIWVFKHAFISKI